MDEDVVVAFFPISGVPLDLHLQHLDCYSVKTWDYVAKWHSHRQHTHTQSSGSSSEDGSYLGAKCAAAVNAMSLEYSQSHHPCYYTYMSSLHVDTYEQERITTGG